MNIEVQLCGLVFDLVLVYFIIRHESVGLYNETIFKQCIAIYTGCVILDILSVFAIVNADIVPAFIVALSSKVYLVSLIVSAYFGFVYTYSDVTHLRENSAFIFIFRTIAVVSSILSLLSPISYYHSGRVVYTYGVSVVITYIFASFFVTAALVFTYKFRKQMNPHRKSAVRLWMSIEIVASLIQFFVPELLLVGFGSSLGLFILYSELENPEVYLDRSTGCFSMDTFGRYVSQEYASLRRFSTIIVCTSEEWKMDDEEENKIILDMVGFLRSFGYAKLFRLTRNDFALVYDKNEQEMNEIESAVNLDVIRSRFVTKWSADSRINARFLYIPDNRAATSVDEFISVYQRNRDNFENDELVKTLDESAGEMIKEFNQMRHEIKDALKEDRVEVFFQPIYSLEKERFVSAEALARLRARDGKLIMPGRFIPVAEETGLIADIGERVFEKTCQFIKNRGLAELGIEYVEVNLSIAQCENPELSNIYQNIMNKVGINPSSINLEITESSTLFQRNVLLDNMNKLIKFGCSFSLDDFGTGESNLNYVVDMPVRIVKFDRSMVQDYFSNDRAKVVMNATVNMIKELELKIVAEGVETEEQVQGIRNLGIDYIQGYYYSKPISENDFVKFITKNNTDVR